MLTFFLIAISLAAHAQTVNEVPVKSSYAWGSGLLNGFNIVIDVFTITHHAKNVKVASLVGMVSGAAAIVLGITNIKKDKTVYIDGTPWVKNTYKGNNRLSYYNIGIGAATLGINAVTFIINNNRWRKTTFNIYSSPGINNSMNVGLVLTRRL